MHLVLLLHFKLVVVVHEEHLLIEVLLQVVLDVGLFERSSSLPSINLLTLQHFVELSLASRQKQLFKVHFSVVRIVKLLKEADAKLDVKVEELGLCRALHEDDLHQLLKQRRVVVKVIHELLLHSLKIILRNFVEQDAKLANLGREFVIRFFLSSEHRSGINLELAFLVWKHEQGHIVRSSAALVLKAQYKVDRVGL